MCTSTCFQSSLPTAAMPALKSGSGLTITSLPPPHPPPTPPPPPPPQPPPPPPANADSLKPRYTPEMIITIACFMVSCSLMTGKSTVVDAAIDAMRSAAGPRGKEQGVRGLVVDAVSERNAAQTINDDRVCAGCGECAHECAGCSVERTDRPIACIRDEQCVAEGAEVSRCHRH